MRYDDIEVTHANTNPNPGPNLFIYRNIPYRIIGL
jgi:hypothetical protein